MNADDRESLASTALTMFGAGDTPGQIIDRLSWSPLVRPEERTEVALHVAQTLAAHHRWHDADGWHVARG